MHPEKKNRERFYTLCSFLFAGAEGADDYVRDQSKGYSVGNTVGKRHYGKRQEREIGKHIGIDHQYVNHSKERSHSRYKFCPDCRSALLKL